MPRHNQSQATVSAAAAAEPRWLLFVHQLPSTSSNPRVRTWRRLQRLGALPIGQALYVLPDSSNAREDFEWLKVEIESAGGQAYLFVAASVDKWSDDALAEEFRRKSEAAYEVLAADANALLSRVRSRSGTTARRPLEQLRARLATIERTDFFGSAGRDRVVALLQHVEDRGRTGAPKRAARQKDGDKPLRGCLWVTRPRPGIDRLSSAWLIRRFIDSEARFGFVKDRDSVPRQALPFDMFGVALTHRGDCCTFETLCCEFNIKDAVVLTIGKIVHDLDLKDGRFGLPEAPTVGLLVDGLQRTHADDDVLLAEGITCFEALYQAFAHANPPPRPRAVAKRPTRRRAPRR